MNVQRVYLVVQMVVRIMKGSINVHVQVDTLSLTMVSYVKVGLLFEYIPFTAFSQFILSNITYIHLKTCNKNQFTYFIITTYLIDMISINSLA